MTAIREALIQAVNGNPVSPDEAWAVIHRWDALEAVADAARECREAMLAERADLLMENGAVFIEMLEEPLARLVAVQDGDCGEDCA